MGLFSLALLLLFAIALIYAAVRQTRLARWQLLGMFVLLNLVALVIAVPRYLVERLDGSMPPTLLQFLAPWGAQILLLLLVDALLIYLFLRQHKSAL